MTHHDRHSMAPDHQRTANDRTAGPELVHLDDLDDYKVADGEPDIRGWSVKTADGNKLGKVDDLLVDTGVMMVRYLDVKLDKNVSNDDDNRHVLVPIARARLDDDHDDVLLGISASEVAGVPPYNRDTWSSTDEQMLLGRYGAASSAGTARTDDNRTGSHDDDAARFFGTRRVGRDSTYITRSE